MKHLLYSICCLVALLVASCGSDTPKCQLEQWGENLLTQYPNYRSNDIAKKSFNDSITAYCESFINKEATLFDGVEFTFKKLVENEQTGTHSAIFDGRVYTEIESNADGGKYLSCTFFLNAMGIVSEDFASSLSSGYKYTLSGKVHAWDGDDMLGMKPGSCTFNDAYLGMFIIDDLKVTKIEE